MAPTHTRASEPVPYINGGKTIEKVKVVEVEKPVITQVVKEVKVPHIIETTKTEKVNVPVLDHIATKDIQSRLETILAHVKGLTPFNEPLPLEPLTQPREFNPAWLAVGAVVVDIATRFIS